MFDVYSYPLQCVWVHILNDVCVEEKKETFHVLLETSDHSDDCVTLIEDTVSVIIADDDCKCCETLHCLPVFSNHMILPN